MDRSSRFYTVRVEARKYLDESQDDERKACLASTHDELVLKIREVDRIQAWAIGVVVFAATTVIATTSSLNSSD